MPRSRVPTVEQTPSLSVLLIGGPDALSTATQDAIENVVPALLVTCDVVQAATTAAEHRPFAIVMSESLHVFDADEFKALARDVGGALVVVATDGRGVRSLSQELTYRLFEAFESHQLRRPRD